MVGRGLCRGLPETVPVQLLEQERPELSVFEWSQANPAEAVRPGTAGGGSGYLRGRA